MDIFDAIEALIEAKELEYEKIYTAGLESGLSVQINALEIVKNMLIDDAHEDAMQMNSLIDDAIHAALYELNLKDDNGDVRKGARVHAMKAYRRVSGFGLSEAIRAVRKLRPDLFPVWDQEN